MIIGPELINGLEYSWIKFDMTCIHMYLIFLICSIGTLSYEKKQTTMQCLAAKSQTMLKFENPLLIVSREANCNKENI